MSSHSKRTTKLPTEVFMCPRFVLGRMPKVFKQNGREIGIRDRAFQEERERWVAAIFLLAMSRWLSKLFWLRSSGEQSPDVYGMSIYKTEKGLGQSLLHLETCEYQENATNGLIGVIADKIKKGYPEYFTLLCYAHSRPGEEIRFEEVVREVAKLAPNIREVWVIIGLRDDWYAVTRVHPTYQEIILNASDFSGLEGQEEILDCSFGNNTEFLDLGEAYIPIAQVKKKRNA